MFLLLICIDMWAYMVVLLYMNVNIIKFRFVFWDVLPCKIIVDRRFRGTCCLHHLGDDSSHIQSTTGGIPNASRQSAVQLPAAYKHKHFRVWWRKKSSMNSDSSVRRKDKRVSSLFEMRTREELSFVISLRSSGRINAEITREVASLPPPPQTAAGIKRPFWSLTQEPADYICSFSALHAWVRCFECVLTHFLQVRRGEGTSWEPDHINNVKTRKQRVWWRLLLEMSLFTYLCPPGWELCVGLTTPPCKNLLSRNLS
jgi:hypothetical protein